MGIGVEVLIGKNTGFLWWDLGSMTSASQSNEGVLWFGLG